MNVWVIIGLIGQSTFFMRFLVQWLVSEKRGESVIPVYFWYLSLIGGVILLIYAVHIFVLVLIEEGEGKMDP